MMNVPLSFGCCHAAHEGETASFYCLEQSCDNNRFFCALCLGTTHKGHSSWPLKFFWHEIQRDSEALENSIITLAKIDALKDQICHLCLAVQDDHLRDLINTSIHQFFLTVDSTCNCKPVPLIQKCLKENKRNQTAKLKQLFKAYCSEWDKNNQQLSSSQPNFTKSLALVIESLKQKIHLMRQAIKKGQIDINLTEIFIQGSAKQKFAFSLNLMHSGLTFIDKNKVKISSYADYNYFALCEPQLSNNKVQTITFSLVNLSSYVTLGICKKNKVQSNYEFVSSGLGHGSFQISYDGYTWSDTDSSINEQYSGWYYNQGDTVTIEFNPKTKKLKFTRNIDSQNPSSYEMSVDYDKSDKMHFCASLNSEPEEVEILM